jgi:asparagine synthase (glutamine-hydrolysing)
MCGIAGIASRTGRPEVVAQDLERMLPGIASRGPDGVGRLVDGGVGLLHTRLAIIDVATGDQPIWNETRTVACIFNGEIYNFRRLRDDLRARGHSFRTQSDTEVLVHLYEDHGVDLLSHVHGMFAFAIFDRSRRTILVARDRLGIKPLYFSPTDGGFAFASSIESLLAVGASRDLDPEAIAQYLRFHRVPEPRTAFRGVRTLLPGHAAVIDAERGTMKAHRFYALPRPLQRLRRKDIPDAVSEARSALRSAIESHLVADVEIAAFLSGGIDSSLVVAEAQRALGRPIRTFCVSFRGAEGYDESAFAERVAKGIGTRHETVVVSAGAPELLRAALRAAQQPFAIASFLPLLLLCEQAAKSVKVVLTGDGGDELAFGYPWYRWMRSTQWVPRPGLRSISQAVRAMEGLSADLGLHRTRRAMKFARGVLMATRSSADAWRYELTEEESTNLLRPEFRPLSMPASPTEDAWNDREEAVAALRRADMEVALRDEMLPKLDRAGMAFGLEGRVPLLDDDFVEAMSRIPARTHMSDSRGKAVLRAWAREMVPGIDAERPKHGFDVPIRAWLLHDLREDVDRLLLDPSRRGLVDAQAAARVWRRVVAGTPGAAHAAYAMLMAELWFEECVERSNGARSRSHFDEGHQPSGRVRLGP